VAAAAVARLDWIDTKEELIVGLDQLLLDDELSIAGSNVPSSDGSAAEAQRDGANGARIHRDNAVDKNSINRLRRMGWQLHRFDVLEDLFDNFTGEVEWDNKDYDHNPQVEDNGQYAPNNK
jgi:hypothetical protein